jgi:hypothetical protein
MVLPVSVYLESIGHVKCWIHEEIEHFGVLTTDIKVLFNDRFKNLVGMYGMNKSGFEQSQKPVVVKTVKKYFFIRTDNFLKRGELSAFQ